MAKNSVSVHKNSAGTTTTTETYSVNSRGRNVTVSTVKTKRSLGSNIAIGSNVFFLIVCVILIIGIVRSLLGTTPITFGGFLDYISSAPLISMTFVDFEVISPLDWSGLLFPVASFINFFINIFNVLIFAFKGLFQVVIYVYYFVKFIFV